MRRGNARNHPPPSLFDRLPKISIPLDEGLEHVRDQPFHADRLTVDLRVEGSITLQAVFQGGRQDDGQTARRRTSQRAQADARNGYRGKDEEQMSDDEPVLRGRKSVR